MLIKLKGYEIMLAAVGGVMRYMYKTKKDLQEAHPIVPDVWDRHIEGALSEMAFARYMGLHWDCTVGELGKADFGHWEIRCTHHMNGHLAVQEFDKDEQDYLLMTGHAGRYIIRGYMKGSEAKQDKYWNTKLMPSPCFAVPQEDLIQMGDN